MGVDVKEIRSHPDKFLDEHIRNVQENIVKIIGDYHNYKIAKTIALFHDIGKINPNFQNKLFSPKGREYSHHSYLSAYIFFCFSVQNKNKLQELLDVVDISDNDIISLTILIARHHGHLPDFSPCEDRHILSDDENNDLFSFVKRLEKRDDFPLYEFLSRIIEVERLDIHNKRVQKAYWEKFDFDGNKQDDPLGFFLYYQFAFASLLLADKADAGEMGNVIDEQLENIKEFSSVFVKKLDVHLSKLDQSTPLNQLRTEIRNCSVRNIREQLDEGEVVFDLTSPTGSGKTLMLLSLAGEIMKAKGAKRIIYALPFLSITEQVEKQILSIFEDYEELIQRIDSKSNNSKFEELQRRLEEIGPDEETKILQELSILEFKTNSFSYPLIITTFVRFFETLLSNRNAELLKLSNFSNCIFLLDEIQALPPRLYGFFVAYLTKFCRKFNSFAIVSTATQPDFKLPEYNKKETKSFFNDYIEPISILPLIYFDDELFNRYQVDYNGEDITLQNLKEQILTEDGSVLVILNTIDDTKRLFRELDTCSTFESEELLLLNTHFTPKDRKEKIRIAQDRLYHNKRVIVVSTQLIEAGVDIDFPVLYRDFATVASIIQSAGRCNRNGTLPAMGRVVLFNLKGENNKRRSELIYQEGDKEILHITRKVFKTGIYQEKDLLCVQKAFFEEIRKNLNFAKHHYYDKSGKEQPLDFLELIKQCQFNTIGKFRLIDQNSFGKEIRCYIPKDENDEIFEDLLTQWGKIKDLLEREDVDMCIKKKRSVKCKLNEMSDQILQVRIKKNDRVNASYPIFPPHRNSEVEREEMDCLYKIPRSCYSFKTGIDIEKIVGNIEENDYECII